MFQRIKSFVKTVLPDSILEKLLAVNRSRLINTFKKLKTNREVFDSIYASKVWNGAYESRSGLGSTGEWLDFSIRWLRENGVISGAEVVEIGCGDFRFGSRIYKETKSYLALDVSSVIINENKVRFKDLDKVSFACVDAAREAIPRGEVYLLRQVLQHLTNRDVDAILRKVAAAKPRHIVVFEDVPSDAFEPNVDMPCSGPFTRIIFYSGLDLRAPPFDLDFSLADECLSPGFPENRTKLVCYHYKRS